MEVYVARQPIFDRKMNVFGYELLYRRSMNNFYEGVDDNQSTAALINNTFLTMQFNELTEGTKGLINFSEKMLVEKIPLLLPKETVIVEILERVEINEKLIDACWELRKAGYQIALDDFVFHESYLPLLEIANIIKIEFPTTPYSEQKRLMEKYKHKIKFLAEKVETREEYQQALDLGYDYFQGFFFSRPVIMRAREIDGLNANLIRILNELNKTEPEYQRIIEIIETDLGLSYKLLKMVNSVYFGSRNRIHSLKQALVRLGIEEIRKWIYLMMLKGIQNVENQELIKNCMIRAKLMELLACEINRRDKHLEYFMTGMFSSIDVLLNGSMKEIIEELPLEIDVKDALLGKNNEIRKAMQLVLNYETLNFEEEMIKAFSANVTQGRFVELYVAALKWIKRLDY